jgi:hypothetical protein
MIRGSCGIGRGVRRNFIQGSLDKVFIWTFMVAVFLSLPGATTAIAFELITAAEAALPNMPDAEMNLRGVTRGPAIQQLSPSPSRGVRSPTPVVVKLIARNKEAIDKDSLKVTYMKAQPIDLTSRIKAFVSDGGIVISEAQIPPGTHFIRIDVKDTQGRASTALLKLAIEGNSAD